MIPPEYSGFAIDFNYSSEPESRTIILACTLTDTPYRVVKNPSEVKNTEIPVGNIKFIQGILGYIVKPDYYPDYLSDYFHRKIWFTNEWPSGRVFIKPSDEYKRFTGVVINGSPQIYTEPFVCSEVVNFVDEWRYYICDGEVLFSGWYDGQDEEPKDAPVLNIQFDKNLCCCLDMGILDNGDLALIESQHPFSCGWYGKPSSSVCRIYTKWVAYGWRYMQSYSHICG